MRRLPHHREVTPEEEAQIIRALDGAFEAGDLGANRETT